MYVEPCGVDEDGCAVGMNDTGGGREIIVIVCDSKQYLTYSFWRQRSVLKCRVSFQLVVVEASGIRKRERRGKELEQKLCTTSTRGNAVKRELDPGIRYAFESSRSKLAFR